MLRGGFFFPLMLSMLVLCSAVGCETSSSRERAERTRRELELSQSAARKRAERETYEADRIATEKIVKARYEAAGATTPPEYHAAAARIEQARSEAIRRTNFALSRSREVQVAAEQRAQRDAMDAGPADAGSVPQ